jgi:hypothetical protein
MGTWYLWAKKHVKNLFTTHRSITLNLTDETGKSPKLGASISRLVTRGHLTHNREKNRRNSTHPTDPQHYVVPDEPVKNHKVDHVQMQPTRTLSTQQEKMLCNRFFSANKKCNKHKIVGQWDTFPRHTRTNMAPKTTRTRKTRNENSPTTPSPGITIDGNAEGTAAASINQVSIQTDTNIGSVETAREGAKLNDDMEIDQLRSSSSPEHTVLGNDSPTQTIRDGLVSNSGGVSSGLFTDLDPQKWAAPQCPECELEPTQDLKALRLAFAASSPTLSQCMVRREALEDMLSAATLWDAELTKHTGRLNEGLTKANESIILLTQPLAVFIFRLYTPTVIGRAIKITPDRGDRAFMVIIKITVQYEIFFVRCVVFLRFGPGRR